LAPATNLRLCLLEKGKNRGGADISVELPIFVQVHSPFLKGDCADAQVTVEKCVLWWLQEKL